MKGGMPQIQTKDGNGVHLPPMPMTPTV